MKDYYVLLVILFLYSQLAAQKHDYIWVFGYDSEVEDTLFGGSFIDFNEDEYSIYSQDLNIDFYINNTSISDSNGQLLFFTNGIQIENGFGEIITNGTGLNPGPIAESFRDFGYPLDQGALFLPNFKESGQYYLIHASREYPNNIISDHTRKLYFSKIELSDQYPGGRVLSKNQIIIDDFMEPGKVTACKHANGRDWWLLIRRYGSNEFHRILFHPEEFTEKESQIIGDSIPSPGLGQAVFAPDGSKFVSLNMIDFEKGNFLNIYDFDRCSGLLSNPTHLHYADSAASGGIAISPNSRFLYVSSSRYIYQYDLLSSNISASIDTVAVYDGFRDPFPTLFFLSQLGPDGKIYINASNGSRVLHIIHHPNLKGEACMVEQHGITLPTYNASSLPNFPNYRLGPLEGSPCDTLTVTSTLATPTRQLQLEVYPNPSTDFLYLRLSRQNTVLKAPLSWRLLSALGQEVKQLSFTNKVQEQRIEILDLSNGIYFWELRSLGGVMDSGKLVKR